MITSFTICLCAFGLLTPPTSHSEGKFVESDEKLYINLTAQVLVFPFFFYYYYKSFPWATRKKKQLKESDPTENVKLLSLWNFWVNQTKETALNILCLIYKDV